MPRTLRNGTMPRVPAYRATQYHRYGPELGQGSPEGPQLRADGPRTLQAVVIPYRESGGRKVLLRGDPES